MSSATASVSNRDEITEQKLKEIFDKLDIVSGDELRRLYAEFAKQYPDVLLGGKPADEDDPDEPTTPPLAVPDEGRVKDWGANMDSSKWKVTTTKDKKYGEFKVVDDGGKNVADGFTTEEKAKYFIEYYQKTNTVPTDNPGTKPDVPDEPDPEPDQPSPQPQTGFPVPPGFTTVGKASTAFKHWGRHETNYASGGSGPSERWDNKEVQALNVLAGYEANLGVAKGKRGEDNIDLKFRGDSHSDGKGGWYIPYLEWAGTGGIGKEHPHPSTSHLKFNAETKVANVGNIKGDKWVGFLAAVFNDKAGVPTAMLWCNTKGTGKMADYIYMGKSKDTGNMKPGPVLTKIAQTKGGDQSLQIRMDEVPDAKIRNAFAIEIQPPE